MSCILHSSTWLRRDNRNAFLLLFFLFWSFELRRKWMCVDMNNVVKCQGWAVNETTPCLSSSGTGLGNPSCNKEGKIQRWKNLEASEAPFWW